MILKVFSIALCKWLQFATAKQCHITHFGGGQNFKDFNFSTLALCKWLHYATAKQCQMILFRESRTLKDFEFLPFAFCKWMHYATAKQCQLTLFWGGQTFKDFNFLAFALRKWLHYATAKKGQVTFLWEVKISKIPRFWLLHYANSYVMRTQIRVIWHFSTGSRAQWFRLFVISILQMAALCDRNTMA